jgi:hypothetical protein
MPQAGSLPKPTGLGGSQYGASTGINPGARPAGLPAAPGGGYQSLYGAQPTRQTTAPTTAPTNPWGAVDPSSQWTGHTARADLERRLGRPLSEADLARAREISGYQDQTGNAQMTGAQMNMMLREGARLTGGTYADWGGVDSEGHGGSSSGSESGSTTNGPTWDVPDAPSYEGPDYQRGPAYQGTPYEQYGEFHAPTQEEAQNDQGYQFALNQGNRGIENSAASRGMLRGSNTLQQVAQYNQGLASQQYDKVYNRRVGEYGMGQDEHRYTSGQARDEGRYGYEANQNEGRYAHEQATNNAQLRYAPELMTWQARNEANQRQSELGFDRDWQRETYNRDDAWRRYQYGNDDQYRRWQEDNANRRFLVGQGNY